MVAGARAEGYSPANDAISLLAAADASTRWWMTAGFVCFGVAVPVYSLMLRREFHGPAWIAAAVSGFATLGVALAPLHVSDAVSVLHGVFASAGYFALASVPLIAAGPLRRDGHRGAAAASVAVSVVSALSLVGTTVAEANGFYQRLGLTVVDVWLVASAVAFLLQPNGSSARPAATSDGRS